MLYFVQQFGRDWLQTMKYRRKCCTFYNFEPQMRVIAPFLLYKIQHLLALLKIAPGKLARTKTRGGSSIASTQVGSYGHSREQIDWQPYRESAGQPRTGTRGGGLYGSMREGRSCASPRGGSYGSSRGRPV
jgi:hypothetical protein